MNNTTYSAGTVSVSTGGVTVTGMGTAWEVYGVRAGDVLLLGGQSVLIAGVNSNTSITLKHPWSGAAQSGAAYDIFLIDDKVRALVTSSYLRQALSGGTLTSLGEISGSANKMPYWIGAGVMGETDLTAQMRGLLGSILLSRSGNNIVTDAAARITGGAVTQSILDTTAGLLLKAGDLGLGTISGIPAPSNDANLCVVPAFNYRFSTTGTNTPTQPYGGSLSVFLGTGGMLYQLWFGQSRRMFFRKSINYSAPYTWHAWQRIMDAESIVGTVAMADGVPSGAILERGSNANGEYVRFVDGTQICMGDASFASVGNASGSGFVSAVAFWTFPASFTTAEAVRSISGHSGLDCKVTAQGGSTVGSNIRLESLASISAARSARVMAIGRWY